MAMTTDPSVANGLPGLQSLEAARRGPLYVLRSLIRALRPHQWAKNLLVFVPALAAHRLEWSLQLDLILAFCSLSLCASGGYVVNDLLDVQSDRRHPRKRFRPFASGDLSIGAGVLLVAGAWALGLGLAASYLPSRFILIVLLYLLAAAIYSLLLKREAVLDVMFLAGFYVMRVIAGGAAASVHVSTWMLAFTLFICLSLAFLKRFVEVRSAESNGLKIPGRDYFADDAGWLHSSGTTCAYLSAVVLAIYANNPDVTRLYGSPDRLLLLCPVLLYGATRIWLKAHRGEIHDDPLIAVAADPATYILIAISGFIVWAAI
jgi:4-hydroxybenzoate polyprenyltransferase